MLWGTENILAHRESSAIPWCTGCGRKNSPIWEGHSFGWGARRRTAVYVPFSVYTMAWSGERRAFIVEEFIKNGGSPVATQRAFRIRFAPGRRDTVPDKKTIYRWVSNFRQTGSALKQTSPGRPRTATPPLHLKWLSRSWTTTERGYISVSIFKAAYWVMFCSIHVDVKRHSVYFPEIKKTFAVSSLVLNLLASQIGDFFLPHPVVSPSKQLQLSQAMCGN
jgi:hypothetical protein